MTVYHQYDDFSSFSVTKQQNIRLNQMLMYVIIAIMNCYKITNTFTFLYPIILDLFFRF